ncbi:hypothetical protein FW774_11280 [Pedobacter sp. BS3]|uniref:neutral/alkaline non-lysosomal ceramidase N-terminal domain-containing protein n=1 Tax=Pedobacter sp. BS3 TaxID=2567937 RepID=UPI0011EE4518|nr:neutral/alkaline non-lysosomal ceramidase N-terminal domain-containing protein [Pedobacter sp. BS3]TZF84020.1 hypothetical protein FW774_11280 [Pedobacter sp. BS3]
MKTIYPEFRHSGFYGLIGLSQSDITPPVGIYARNWGAAKTDVATGVHQPLLLGCITFQSVATAQPLVIITVDLGWWKNIQDERFVRQAILDALKIDHANLMICLSHTHAGPGLCRDDVSKPGGQYIEPYLLHVRDSAIAAVRKALSGASWSNLTWHYGSCNLAANRDLTEAGKTRTVVGFNPAAAPDNTLLVGRITNSEGDITGTIVNYACHPTTLAWDNQLISPDYVGAMRSVVQDGTQAPCMFLQGASGELAPTEQYSGDTTLAERHGKQLGYAVLSTLQAMLAPGHLLAFDSIVESGAPLAVWRQKESQVLRDLSARVVSVKLPLKELEPLSVIEKQWENCTDHVLKERLWRKLNVRKAVGNGSMATVPLWVWQLGNSFLTGQPNEAYSLFQTNLRERFPSYAIAVMNVVNGHIGYLPPQGLYNDDRYAVWQTPFAKGSLETLISTATEAIQLMANKK